MLGCRLQFFAWYSQKIATDNQDQVITHPYAFALNGTR